MQASLANGRLRAPGYACGRPYSAVLVALIVAVCGVGLGLSPYAALWFSVPALLFATGLLLGCAAFLTVRASQRARAASERATVLFEQAPVGNLVVARDGRIAQANAHAAEIFGYPAKVLCGMRVNDLVPHPVRKPHAAMEAGFWAAPDRRRMGERRHIEAQRGDGQRVPVEVGLSPVCMQGREIVLVTVMNVSARWNAERALQSKTEALARSNAALSEYAYVASHDLQEPLRMVTSHTELLAERFAAVDDERAGRYVRHIVDGARRMRQLIDDLLALSREGAAARELGTVEAQDALDTALENLSVTLTEASGRVTHGALPSIVADRGQLTRLFQNLIGNALKFHGDEPPVVHVSAERHEDAWTFCVRDNGVGFEMAYAERIFAVFQRLHERGAFSGSGIGLSICKKIVAYHGGRIWAESRPGAGAAFYFTWPDKGVSSGRDPAVPPVQPAVVAQSAARTSSEGAPASGSGIDSGDPG